MTKLNWEKDKARHHQTAPSRQRSKPPSLASLTRWLEIHHARLVPPDAEHPYWTVYQLSNRPHGPSRFLAAGSDPRAAITRAMMVRTDPR